MIEDRIAATGVGATQRADAFRRLAERHLERSYRLAYAVLHNPADAEDATHDAFVTAWRKWHTLRDVTRFEQWFDRILINTCRNWLRRTKAVPGLWEGLSGTATDEYGPLGDRASIASALASLDPDHRVIVALRYYADLTIDEIARRVGVPSGTVKSRLHYGLRRLHEALDEAETQELLR